MQITADDPADSSDSSDSPESPESPDLAIPGERYSFGVLASAQAQGDFEVLTERGRRVLWVRLADVEQGLPRLRALVEAAL